MKEEQSVTPWDVEGATNDSRHLSIDYTKIVKQFGCQFFDDSIVARFSKLPGVPLHHFFRRNIVFAHRDFDGIIESLKNGKKFYLYTGRGPSSKSMHLGHAIPFLLCKYLQKAFSVPLVIQITDDEKFLWKNMTLEEAYFYGQENIKDIIAFGFDPKLTFIFSNLKSSHCFQSNILKISKAINLNEVFKIFGFNLSSNIGQIEFPAKEIAPCFSSSFRFLSPRTPCLVPAAVDQDPFFRLARDKANLLNELKPSSLYVSLLPDLKGTHKKMSASDPNSSIYLNDTPEQIRNKINKFAFSGGKETLEEHRRLGGDIEVDVSYQYLRYFLDEDEELEKYKAGYVTGKITSGEMKKKCIEVIQAFVERYTEERRKITDEIVSEFMDIDQMIK